jgi:hypothetical protein
VPRQTPGADSTSDLAVIAGEARWATRPTHRAGDPDARAPENRPAPPYSRAAVAAAIRSANSCTGTLPSSPSPWRRTATVPDSASRSPTISM